MYPPNCALTVSHGVILFFVLSLNFHHYFHREAAKSQPFADGTLTTEEINSSTEARDNAVDKRLHHTQCVFKDTINHTVCI